MPRRDGTGPEGNGIGTGRGMGPCNGNNDAATPGLGRRGEEENVEEAVDGIKTII